MPNVPRFSRSSSRMEFVVNARNLLPALDGFLLAHLLHGFGAAVARQIAARTQTVHILLEPLRPHQLFMAAIEEIFQVLQKLPQVSGLDEALQSQLVNPLPQKNVNVFRQQQVEILACPLEYAQAIRMKCAGKDRGFKHGRFAPQPLLHPGLQFVRRIVSERDGQDLLRPWRALAQSARQCAPPAPWSCLFRRRPAPAWDPGRARSPVAASDWE